MTIIDLPPTNPTALGVLQQPQFDGKDELAAYLEYNKILRSWFVAFGVGGPALFLINESAANHLIDSGQLGTVAALFLVGTGAQVGGTLVNKICNWYVYRGASDRQYQSNVRYKISVWLVQQFWIDIALDLTTIATFALCA